MLTLPSRLTRAVVATAIPLALVLAAGCSQNPYFSAQNSTPWQAPQTPAVSQNEASLAELNRRVQLLDDNNRQLHTQLAQSEQKSQVYRDESELLRSQLAELSQQMETTKIAAREAENQVRGMQASTQLRGSASIQANTDLSQRASQLNLGGIPIEQDGEVIRIILSSDQLFQPGTAQLQPQASTIIDPIAAQIRTLFPKQRLGIEGYTDNAQLYGGTVATTHQLASAQASAVLDMLTRRSGMSPQQLFTVAQGANNPRQPNTTAAGRAANRRIELVIYPDTY